MICNMYQMLECFYTTAVPIKTAAFFPGILTSICVVPSLMFWPKKKVDVLGNICKLILYKTVCARINS